MSYGDVLAVDDVSFDIETGSVVGLLGPNGAGKTTIIKSMLGLLVPDAGEIDVVGESVRDDPSRIHGRIGVMFEGSRDAYWRLTVRENLEFFTRLNGYPASSRRERHDELLSRLDLMEKADTPVRHLSRGQKQKVALASTLSGDIEVAFLDEPTLGLDVESSLVLQDELRSLVADRDLTVVITSHDMDVIENICDRVIVVSNGQIIADDAVGELLASFTNDGYRVRLTQPVTDETINAIESQFAVSQRQQYGNVVEFELTLVEDDFHALSNALEALDCTVRSIETIEPDLQDAFLSLTEETNA